MRKEISKIENVTFDSSNTIKMTISTEGKAKTLSLMLKEFYILS